MASDLVDYVTKLLPGAAPVDLSADIKKREFAPVVAAIAPKAPQLLALEAETDVEGAFALLWDVVLQLPTDQAESEALKLLQTVADSQSGAVFRLRIAANLFNKAKTLPKVEMLVDAQKISVEDRRVLLLKVADLLSKSHDTLKVLAVLEKYLATFEQDKAAEAKATAERAAKLVLQNPVASFLARVNLITSPVVAAALKGSKLYELLDVVSTKTLKEFVAFQKNAGDVFTKYELKQEELADTMRLFTLCSLPTGFKEIPYAEVAAVLELQEEDVEKWVVRAITSGLVSAKIDQLSRTVVISRSLQRGFGAEQWKEIDAKLQLYKKNVGGLLDVIKNARRAQEQQ
ncbi:hypothetical protein BBO99_00002198 [Phytophthora kernoviae]|uniref:PCI domain-containing protein n=2 Tax=Phytophthora kernoviae TaxID=325452 RepID=A0A3R7IGM5_9STRA|nr:hypothetical protein G195_002479 [Phytophthora kernoviae 00238/432]KAG2529833.1 hypothetical protein JM16_001794 [Phytophthora kernoviae]KAG2531186.1 hypothetical protein JM18_001781 [Phytophthora kernoviae]RLN10604.1 hypothetical protein BBI17_001881 [Phytophthora kernoviae]RLN83368.1 hypothetical protein BBO99_00002198 [Phytophthora kernoviae]